VSKNVEAEISEGRDDAGDKDEADEDEDECDKEEEEDKVDDVAEDDKEGDVGENSRLENSFVVDFDFDFAKALAQVELPSSRS